MDSAPDFESGGWGFESLRDRFGTQSSAIGLVVKYLVANEVPRVRFPDGACSCGAVGSASVLCADGPGFEPLQEHFCVYIRDISIGVTITICLPSYAHTMVKPPDPIRTPKLSTIGPAQYCGGGPRGNRRWCTFCIIMFLWPNG